MSATRPTTGDCRAQLEELFAYLDDELSPARCRRIERHLRDCPCCGALTERLQSAMAVCRAAGRERLPNAMRQRAQVRVARLLDAVELTRGDAMPKQRRESPSGSRRTRPAGRRRAGTRKK